MTIETVGNHAISRLINNFQAEHPEYGNLDTQLLTRLLDAAYKDVVQGHYVAKNEDQLQNESQLTGLTRNHYLDLVNLTVHAASNVPLEDGR